jgi:hypothetical protein
MELRFHASLPFDHHVPGYTQTIRYIAWISMKAGNGMSALAPGISIYQTP